MKIIYSILLILLFISCAKDNKIVNFDNVKYVKIFYIVDDNSSKYIKEADHKKCLYEKNLVYIGTLETIWHEEEMKKLKSCFYSSVKYEDEKRLIYFKYLKIPPPRFVIELDNKKRIYLNSNFFFENGGKYEFKEELNINLFKLSR